MVNKKIFFFSITLFYSMLILSASCKKSTVPSQSPAAKPSTPATNIAIPLAGNGYITQSATNAAETITDNGLANWTDAGSITSTYFRVGQTGQLHVAIKASVPSGSSSVKVSVNGTAFIVNLTGNGAKTYFAGTLNIAAVGYVKVDLQGISKTGSYFADVSAIMIGGAATLANLVYANDPANYYWSRRGPSCHLGYTTPAADKEYFYSFFRFHAHTIIGAFNYYP